MASRGRRFSRRQSHSDRHVQRRLQICPHSPSLPFPSRPSRLLLSRPNPYGRRQADRQRPIGKRYQRAPPRKSCRPTLHTSYTALRRSGPCLSWGRIFGHGIIQALFVRSIVSFRATEAMEWTPDRPGHLSWCIRSVSRNTQVLFHRCSHCASPPH